jgi:RNA polymerase sigma-70 factor, ECF subfamily
MRRADRGSCEDRFEQLYRSTAQDLLAYVTRRARDPEEATDILAEVYVIAWRRLDKVPSDDTARLWLFGVARNLLMKRTRAERSHQALMGALASELRRVADDDPEPLREGVEDKVRAALEGLPVKQREVLLLTAWEGLKPREIACVTGTTANVVRVRLHQARTRLRRALDPAPSPENAEDPLLLTGS